MKQKRKRRYLIALLSIFLLGFLIVTQAVAAAPLQEPNAAANSSTNYYFDVTGNKLSITNAKKIQKLLNSIKSTEKFGVYANKIDRTNHIEGNVYVNEVADSSNFVLTRVSEKQEEDFSYIGASIDSIQISDGEKILLGPGINVSKPNENQTIINGGYSNNIDAVILTDEEAAQMSTALQNKLAEISQVSESAKGSVDTSFYGNSKDSFESVNNLLEKPAIGTDCTAAITEGVISINVDYKQLLNNEGAFGHLINNNPGVRIVVNVIFQDTPSDINIMKAFSSNTSVNTEFHKLSPYIIWNFGNYSGNITISEEMVGIIVAPEATVYQSAGNLNGQIISNVAGNNGELHQVTVTPDVPGIQEESENPDIPEDTEKPNTPEDTEKPNIPEDTEKPNTPDDTEKSDDTEESENPGIPEVPNHSKDDPGDPGTLDNTGKIDIPEEHKNSDTPEAPVQITKQNPSIVTSEEQKTEQPSKVSPKTGDNTSIYTNAFIILVGLAVTIVFLLCTTKRKKF